MSTYTITGDTGGVWGTTMSYAAWASMSGAADDDVYNFPDAAYAMTNAAVSFVFDGPILNFSSNATFTAAGASSRWRMETNTGMIINGPMTIDCNDVSSNGIVFGTNGLTDVVVATLNDVTITSATNQCYQNYAAAQVTYNNCSGLDAGDDGMSCHDDSITVCNDCTFTGSNQNIQQVNESDLTLNNCTLDNQSNFNSESGDYWTTAASSSGSTTFEANDCFFGGGVGGASAGGWLTVGSFNRCRFGCKDTIDDSSGRLGEIVNFGNGSANRNPSVKFNSCIWDEPTGSGVGHTQLLLRLGDLSTSGDVNNCTFYGESTGIGCQLTKNTGYLGTINNSTFVNAATGVIGSTGSTMDNCNFDNCTVDVSSSIIQTNTTTFSSGFVNPPTDLHLLETSDLRALGSATFAPGLDFDSVAFASPPSVGAYEFVLSSGSPTLTRAYIGIKIGI